VSLCGGRKRRIIHCTPRFIEDVVWIFHRNRSRVTGPRVQHGAKEKARGKKRVGLRPREKSFAWNKRGGGKKGRLWLNARAKGGGRMADKKGKGVEFLNKINPGGGR